MTYTMDYTATINAINSKQKKLWNEMVANDSDPTEEMLENANKYWELAYKRTAELATANCLKFYGSIGEAFEWLSEIYDGGETWPDDEELLDALECLH